MTPPKILNVDDQHISRYIRTQTLEAAGYEVIEAATGAEALRLLDSQRPQVVLLDMNLPDIHGTEICRRIRAEPSTSSIIVVHVSSTHTSPQDRALGLDGGADGYLTEPVEPELLLATVRSFLRLSAVELQLERSLAEIRELAARYQSLTEAVPHIVYTTAADGGWDYVSQQFADYADCDTSHALKSGWLNLVHPGDRQAASEDWARSVGNGRPFETEYRFRRADGSYRWHLVRARPVRANNGGILQWVGTSTDIHERKIIDEELRLRHREFVALAENSPDIIARYDTGLRYTYVNHAVSRFSTISHEQYIGKTNLEMGWPSELCVQWDQACARAILTSQPQQFEFSRILTGGPRHFQARVVPEFGAPGSVTSLLAITTDITDLRLATLALQRSNEDLTQFAYAASHDLQEPLRTVASYTELLARQCGDGLGADAQTYISFTQDAVRRMQILIQDLLVYSKLQNTAVASKTAVAMKDTVQAALANLKNAIDENGARISYGDLPSVRADSAQIAQVFQNLIGNAIKYRQLGQSPEVEISATADAGGWVICVRDNGVGFDQKDAEKIFGIFKRLHGREIPGTGVGLAIVKKIVERHGGQIWAESVRGQGAAFYFRLPGAAHSNVEAAR